MDYRDTILVGDQVVYKGVTRFRLSSEASEIPDLSRLKELLGLDMDGCHKIKDLSPLSKLRNLRHLFLDGCTGIMDLSPFASLEGLWSLSMSGCTGVVDISPIANLPFLWIVGLAGCTGLQDLSPLIHREERGCKISLPWLYLASHTKLPWWQRPIRGGHV